MSIEDILELGVAAVLPVYESGNVTRLIASDGTELTDPRTCRTVLKCFARIYGIDLAAVRESYGRAINKKHAVPIPFGLNMILIPVKIREKPLGENDGTFGYVNFREVQRVDDAGGRACRVALKCGKTVDILSSRATMLDYIKNGRLVESLYRHRHFYGPAEALGASGCDAVKVKERDVLQESGEDLQFLRKCSLLQEDPQMQDDLLRVYLLELLARVLLQRKKDRDPA